MSNQREPVNIAVVDQRRLVRDGASMLGGQGVTVVGAVADAEALAQLCAQTAIDTVVVGLTSSNHADLCTAADVTETSARVIEAATRPSATRDVLGGVEPTASEGSTHDPQPLTPRQQQVLTQLCRGRTTSEVATALHIAPKTAAHHVQMIFRRLGVHSRAEAVRRARQFGLLSAATEAED